jgi:hypothetical protein
MTDEKETSKKRIIELSLKHKILSPHTAFVGVEKRMNRSNAEMVLREVPIQISADDQCLQMLPGMLRGAHGGLFKARGARKSRKQAASPKPKNPSKKARACKQTARKLTGGHAPRMQVAPCSARVYVPEMSMLHQLNAESVRLPNVQQYCSGMMNAPQKSISNPSTRERAFDEWHENMEQEESCPTDDQNIVRHLIKKQKFDGLWELDAKTIERLTGKPLMNFSQLANPQVLMSAIVVVILETRFISFSTMWQGVVQKAHQRLLDLFGHDNNQLNFLLERIRQQL